MMECAKQSGFSIGDWRAFPHEDLLCRGNERVRLEPKAMEVLVFLASHPGEVVSRGDLEATVWRGGLVGYDAVTGTVIKLRKALGDDAHEPRFIATIPKRGYQLIAEVTPLAGEASSTSIGMASTTPVDYTESVSQSGRPRVGWLGLSLLLVVTLAVALFVSLRPPTSGSLRTTLDTAPIALPSIAVLPFANISGDPEQEYFVDGITEDIVTDISRLSNLRVIAWGTSRSYKGTTLQPLEIANELRVAYVLDGSVRKAGDRLRITAELVDGENGNHLWAQRYDRKLADIFTLQDEVTRTIVKALSVRLTAAEEEQLAHSNTNNLGAYDAFLRGQQYYQQRTKEGNQMASEAYRQAIALDPSYARAYGALAIILTNDYRNGWTELSLEEARARSLELAQKAVALDPSSPQAYWALGFAYLFRKQYDDAAAAAQQAVALSPNYADGYGLLALINNFLGRGEDAVRYIQKAMTLNPSYSYDYPWNLGCAYYTLRRYAEAAEALQEATRRNENALEPRLFLAATYVRLDRQDDAEWEIEQVEILNPNTTLTSLANTFPIQNPDDMKVFLGDLRKAGLPE